MSGKKIAILFRGAMRPNPEAVARRIQDFVAHTRELGLDPVTYLATWDTGSQVDLASSISSAAVDNLFIFKPFTDEEILDAIKVPNFGNGRPTVNAFRQYFMSRQAVNAIAADWRFTHIVHTRTDMDFAFAGAVEDWFNDRYRTIHTLDSHPGAFVNDQIGVAPPDVMRAAWDYQSLDRLSAMFQAADKPEDVLQAILDGAGVKAAQAPVAKWTLDPIRLHA